jgi:hypothetical protein
MSDFKVGDRVRVTSVVEGVVTSVHGAGDFEVEGPHYFSGKTDTEVSRTVEILERKPEPFAVGTVVRAYGQSAFRTKGGWVWHTGEESDLDDDWFRHRDIEILHAPPSA